MASPCCWPRRLPRGGGRGLSGAAKKASESRPGSAPCPLPRSLPSAGTPVPRVPRPDAGPVKPSLLLFAPAASSRSDQVANGSGNQTLPAVRGPRVPSTRKPQQDEQHLCGLLVFSPLAIPPLSIAAHPRVRGSIVLIAGASSSAPFALRPMQGGENMLPAFCAAPRPASARKRRRLRLVATSRVPRHTWRLCRQCSVAGYAQTNTGARPCRAMLRMSCRLAPNPQTAKRS